MEGRGPDADAFTGGVTLTAGHYRSPLSSLLPSSSLSSSLSFDLCLPHLLRLLHPPRSFALVSNAEAPPLRCFLSPRTVRCTARVLLLFNGYSFFPRRMEGGRGVFLSSACLRPIILLLLDEATRFITTERCKNERRYPDTGVCLSVYLRGDYA